MTQILLCCANPEQALPKLKHQFIPLLAIVVLAMALAACGRRGPLDPPPGGYAFDPGTVRTPTTNRGLRRENEQKPPEQYDDEGRPVVPEGAKKKLPGDWLID
jgi:predicted small lipoprotein YifL